MHSILANALVCFCVLLASCAENDSQLISSPTKENNKVPVFQILTPTPTPPPTLTPNPTALAIPEVDHSFQMPGRVVDALGVHVHGAPTAREVGLIKEAQFNWVRGGIKWAVAEGCPAGSTSDTTIWEGHGFTRPVCCNIAYIQPQPGGWNWCAALNSNIFDPLNPTAQWSFKYQQKGVYDFSDTIAYRDRMHASGLKIAYLIGTGVDAEHPLFVKLCPDESQDEECREARIDGALKRPEGGVPYLPAYATNEGRIAFAKFYAQALAQVGGKVDTWLFWNEANSGGFWHPKPDPKRMAWLLQSVTQEIANYARASGSWEIYKERIVGPELYGIVRSVGAPHPYEFVAQIISNLQDETDCRVNGGPQFPQRQLDCCNKKYVTSVNGQSRCSSPDDSVFDPGNPKRAWSYKPKAMTSLDFLAGISVHGYRFSSEDTNAEPETQTAEYEVMKRLLKKGYAGKTGSILAGEVGKTSLWYGERGEASWTVRHFVNNLYNGVPLTIVYHLVDNLNETESDYCDSNQFWFGDPARKSYDAERCFGLLKKLSPSETFVAKEAFTAVKTMTSLIGQLKFDKKLSVGTRDDHVFSFSNAQAELAICDNVTIWPGFPHRQAACCNRKYAELQPGGWYWCASPDDSMYDPANPERPWSYMAKAPTKNDVTCGNDVTIWPGFPHRQGTCCNNKYVQPQPGGWNWCASPDDTLFDPLHPEKPWSFVAGTSLAQDVALVAWTTGPAKTITLPFFNGTTFDVYDLLGNSLGQISSANGSLTTPALSGDPIYLIPRADAGVSRQSVNAQAPKNSSTEMYCSEVNTMHITAPTLAKFDPNLLTACSP